MNDIPKITKITQRLNFFTGFFTTAQDWNDGQDYHLAKRMLHNRRLHTPGIIPAEKEELNVKAAGNLMVKVLPGAALDGWGHEIYRAQEFDLNLGTHIPSDTDQKTVYITIQYAEEETDHAKNIQSPQYSGYTRVTESSPPQVIETQPDNKTQLELARIQLQKGVQEIINPADPQNPLINQIDRRYVVWAGAVGLVKEELSPSDLQGLIQLMEHTRENFAALDHRFPVPSASDVRHAALTVGLLARSGSLHERKLPGVLAALAAVELAVKQDLANVYPILVETTEFQNYQKAVADLQDALRQGQIEWDDLRNLQDQVAIEAEQISKVIFQIPVAHAGSDLTVTTSGNEAVVMLDAGASQAFAGRQITKYSWNKAG